MLGQLRLHTMTQCLVSVLVALALASRSQAVIVESPAGLWDERLPQKPQDQSSKEHCKTVHIISVRENVVKGSSNWMAASHYQLFQTASTHTHHGAYTLERDHTRTANGQCTAPFAQKGTCGSLAWTARRTAPFPFTCVNHDSLNSFSKCRKGFCRLAQTNLWCFSLTGYPAFLLRTMRGFNFPMCLPQMIFFERKKRLKYNIW